MSKILTKKGKIIVTNYAIFFVTAIVTAVTTTYFNKLVILEKKDTVGKALGIKKELVTPYKMEIIKSVDDKDIYTSLSSITDDLKKAIYKFESNNNSKAVSPSGNHVGICQMGNNALLDVNYTKGIKTFKEEPLKVQDKYCTDRFVHLFDILKKKELPTSIFNIYILHQQGENTGLKILKDKKLSRYELHKIADNISQKELLKAYKEYTYNQLEKGL